MSRFCKRIDGKLFIIAGYGGAGRQPGVGAQPAGRPAARVELAGESFDRDGP
jgi:hypothetical protein